MTEVFWKLCKPSAPNLQLPSADALSLSPRSEEVSGAPDRRTTGVMCNYRVTPECTSPMPAPLPRCESALLVPETSKTHTLLVSHTSMKQPQRPPSPCRGF